MTPNEAHQRLLAEQLKLFAVEFNNAIAEAVEAGLIVAVDVSTKSILFPTKNKTAIILKVSLPL